MAKGKTYKFYGTAFEAATAYGTNITITGISNALQAVVTAVAHGLTGHGVVKISGAVGMPEINDHLYVAERISADTLRLVGVDSTNYGVWTSGGVVNRGTFSAHCEQTSYSFDSGSTPTSEEETNCGITISSGAPRLGSLSLGFKAATNAFQEALESVRKSTEEIAFRVTIPEQTKVRYDIGIVTQVTESGSSGGTWDGTASVTLTQERVTVNV